MTKKDFNTFCEQYGECEQCPLDDISAPCRVIFDKVQEYLESEEKEVVE